MIGHEFNTEFIAKRRVETGHSTHTLANHMGVSATIVRSIEGGVSPDMYPFGVIARLAAGLGCAIADLFVAASTPGNDDDIRLVVAALNDAGGAVHVDVLAESLGWTPERCEVALHFAGPALRTVGLALAFHGDMAVAVVAAADVRPPTELIAATTVEIYGLSDTEARVVATLMRTGHLSRSDNPFAVGQLRSAGLVEPARSQTQKAERSAHGVRAAMMLTETARRALCLDGD